MEPHYNFPSSSQSVFVRNNGSSVGIVEPSLSSSSSSSSSSEMSYSSSSELNSFLELGTTSLPFYYTTLNKNLDDYGDHDHGSGGDYSYNYNTTSTSAATSATTTMGMVAGGISNSVNGNSPFFYGMNRTLVISDLPEELRVVDETAWPRIYIYFAVFIVSAIANFCELVWVCKRLRIRASPVNRLFLHLCIADLIVVFMVAAVEVLWRISIGWYAGNFMCKAVMFGRAFGLYLSSMMIIAVSLDRYYAVVHPLRVIDASRRVKIMLVSAWVTAALCAVPQGIVFREETHPMFPMFHQCSTLWFPRLERINSWLSITMMYFVPLGVILFAYGSIIVKIAGYLGENHGDSSSNFLRRNGMPVFQRAKLRTLKLTFMIVLVFLLCWSPYIFMNTWYLIDEKSAANLDGNLQDALFIMAVANSMANPLVYGFNESCKRRNKERRQNNDPTKQNEQRSDGVILNNYDSSTRRMSNRTRVRLSPHHRPSRSAV